MTVDRVCTVLNHSPLFAALSRSQCNEISNNGRLLRYRSGDVLPDDILEKSLCVVISGELVATKKSKSGKKAVRTIGYSVGHFFDPFYLIHGSWIHGSQADQVKALQDTDLLMLDKSVFERVVALFLQRLPFFNSLLETQLQAVAREMFLECYNGGETLFQQDDLANALYLIVSGEVAMVRRYEEDSRVIEEEIRRYGQGEFFGERGLLIDYARAASAKITERTSLLGLPAHRFRTIISDHPDVERSLYRYLANLLEEQSIAFWRAARDIERMQELIQAAKMAALGQLVAGIAHEINTPIGTIYSDSHQFADILVEVKQCFDEMPEVIDRFFTDRHLQAIAAELGYPLDNRTRELVERYVELQVIYLREYYAKTYLPDLFKDLQDISSELDEASSRIRDIVRDLANFARLGEAELKTVDVHEGIDSTLSLLHHELKYKVTVEKEYGDLPEIICYPNQLNQVFMNILMNAIQALELDNLEEGERGLIRIETFQEAGWVVVTISDNGKGIPSENLVKIFEPFFSTKGAGVAAGGLGLGLGLSISKKIVEEKHLGKIEVRSAVGIGTTFSIKLPLDRPLP